MKLSCNFKIYKLNKKDCEELKSQLENKLSESFQGNVKVKITGEKYFARLNNCFAINNCPYQVYLNNRFYCYNQEELKKVYEND